MHWLTSGWVTIPTGTASGCGEGVDLSAFLLGGVGEGSGEDSMSSSSSDSTFWGIPRSWSFRSVSDICKKTDQVRVDNGTTRNHQFFRSLTTDGCAKDGWPEVVRSFNRIFCMLKWKRISVHTMWRELHKSHLDLRHVSKVYVPDFKILITFLLLIVKTSVKVHYNISWKQMIVTQ